MTTDLPAQVPLGAGLGLEPAAHVRWHEQNGWDVTEFSGLRHHPEIEAFWGNRQQLALYTADQVRAAVAAERERWIEAVEGNFAGSSYALPPRIAALIVERACGPNSEFSGAVRRPSATQG